MITAGGNIRTMKSHLQGCDTVSAVRHEAVLFKGRERKRPSPRVRVRVVDPNGHQTQNTVDTVLTPYTLCVVLTVSIEHCEIGTVSDRSPYTGGHSAPALGPQVLMFGYKGNHGTSTTRCWSGDRRH